MRKLLLFFCFCFGLTTATAQYRIDQWTADDGLPQNSVYGIVQTKDGYLWMATLDGLARFDGVRFQVFNKSNSAGIVNNRFTALFESADGDLWAGTEESGIVRRHAGHFSNYLAGEGVRVYWIGSDANGSAMTFLPESKAVHFVDGKFSAFDVRADISEPTRRNGGQSVRITCSADELTSSLSCYANERQLSFSPAEGLPAYNLRSAVREPDGSFWLLNDRLEVVRVENGRVARVFKSGDGLPKFPLDFVTGAKTSLVSWDGQNSLFITDLETMKSELLLKTPADLTPTAGDLYPPFLADENVFSPLYKLFISSYRDAEGNFWFGTIRGGLYRARKQVVKTFSTAEGLTDNVVYPIYEDDDGSLLVGSRRLYKFSGGRFAPVEVPENLNIQAIGKDPAGRIVVSHFNNLYVRDESNRFVPFLEGQIPAADEIYAIHADRENRLWIGGNKGLSRFGDGATTMFTTDSGLAGNDVKVIIDAKAGGVWIGTYGGLSLYRDGKLTSWTENDGLPSRTIRALYEDADGALWIGTYDGGLARFKDGKFTAYNSKIGLYTDEAFQILEDDNRNFWISSNHGIYLVSKDELNDYADGRRDSITSIAYGKADGMLNAECNGGRSPAGVKTRDGRLWFPTQDGVAMIDPKEIKINSQPPPVVIETVKIDNTDVGFENANLESDGEESKIQNLKAQIQVEPSQQSFEIAYTALSFINSENLRFKYKLEGLDDDWIDAGTRRLAYFSHVPPGDYTFRVLAANSDNVWNETGASLKIKVLPPFYRTWWFYALSILGVCGLLTFVYLYRVRRLKALNRSRAEFSRHLIESQETERRRIALELHDSLGQTLAVIRNRTLMGLDAENFPQAIEQFREISEASTLALRETRDIAHNLHPAQIENLGLTTALRTLVKSIESATGIKCETEIEEVPDRLPYDAAIAVYRISQETLTNIIRHSDASLVRFNLRVEKSRLALNIEDDGRGFREDQITKGLGLNGIRERAIMIGGEISIVSQPGEGTRTTLTLDLDRR